MDIIAAAQELVRRRPQSSIEITIYGNNHASELRNIVVLFNPGVRLCFIDDRKELNELFEKELSTKTENILFRYFGDTSNTWTGNCPKDVD